MEEYSPAHIRGSSAWTAPTASEQADLSKAVAEGRTLPSRAHHSQKSIALTGRTYEQTYIPSPVTPSTVRENRTPDDHKVQATPYTHVPPKKKKKWCCCGSPVDD